MQRGRALGKFRGRRHSREPYPTQPAYHTDEQRMVNQQWEDSERHRQEIRRQSSDDLALASRALHGQDTLTKGSGAGGPRFVHGVDPTRRDSRPAPEPSPRERGMIDHPRATTGAAPANPSRRPSSSIAWPHDKQETPRERDRETSLSSAWGDASTPTTSRRFSLDKPTDHAADIQPPQQQPPRSPKIRTPSISASVNESPISASGLLAAQPPTPTMANPTAPPSRQFSHPPLEKGPSNVEMSRLFLDAAYSYFKFREAAGALHLANEERKHHEEHFKLFPAMRDRFDTQLSKAKKDKEKANDDWAAKNEPFERYISLITRDRISSQDSEPALATARQLAHDLGNNSLEQYVKSLVRSQISNSVTDEVGKLRDELRDMKRKQSEEERLRQENAKDLLQFKNDQSVRLQQQDELKLALTRIEEEHNKTADELRRTLKDVENSLREMQSETSGKTKKSPERHPPPSPVSHVSMHATPTTSTSEELLSRIETLQQRISQYDDDFSQTKAGIAMVRNDVSKVKAEAQNSLQRIESLEKMRPPSQDMNIERPFGVGLDMSVLQEYATINDMQRLEGLIKNNDDVIDTAREVFHSDTASILEELQRMEDKTNADVGKMSAALEGLRARHGNDLRSINKDFTQNFETLRTKFTADMEDIQSRVDLIDNTLDGLSTGIRHVDSRLNTFNAKDFHQKLVNQVVQLYPAYFDQANQINFIVTEVNKLRNAVQTMLRPQQRNQELPNRPPPLSPQAIVPPSPNGVPMAFIPSNVHNLPQNMETNGQNNESKALLEKLQKELKELRDEMQAIDTRLHEHIETYNVKMNDIREWTISATQRLGENTESATIIMEEIKELRVFLNNLHSGSPHVSPTGGDRWRAVAATQETVQALPIDNTSNDNDT